MLDSSPRGRLPRGSRRAAAFVTVSHSPHRRLAALLSLVVAMVGVALLAVPDDAAAAPKCAKLVVADWYGDGRVDRVYPLHCYTDAIRSLPVDVLDYSNAKEDILRALSYAKRGEPDPGNAGADGGGGSSGSSSGGGTAGGSGGDGGSGIGGGRPLTEPDETTGEETLAGGDPLDTSGPSSVPVPLIVLGGLALLLLAAGAAGYLSRRSQAGKAGDGGPGDPAV
jgi:hypothetical protein